jgi:four helix bundle protein
MTYKDLNVYQRAYKVAIDLHQYIEKNEGNFSTDEINQLKSLSRNVLGNIAEGFSQRSSKAKRFFNFKALDSVHTLQMDLDFLHDIQRLPDKEYQKFYEEYDICAKQLYTLNKSILEKANEASKEAVEA